MHFKKLYFFINYRIGIFFGDKYLYILKMLDSRYSKDMVFEPFTTLNPTEFKPRNTMDCIYAKDTLYTCGKYCSIFKFDNNNNKTVLRTSEFVKTEYNFQKTKLKFHKAKRFFCFTSREEDLIAYNCFHDELDIIKGDEIVKTIYLKDMEEQKQEGEEEEEMTTTTQS